jgi:phage baseplate assembly protein W
MNTDFLGKGMAFPLRVNERGGIAAASQQEKVRQSILVILGTQHGERVMRPKFGANLRSLVFAPNNRATANLAQHYVEEALATWEPRIILDEVTVENDQANACLLVQIRYRIKASYTTQSLVYPFYLQQR